MLFSSLFFTKHFFKVSFSPFCLIVGGEGKTGKVLDIRGWDNESERSVANVTWTSGSTNVYRLGHKGKVDLKYIQDAVGGYYYRDHLPILGKCKSNALFGFYLVLFFPLLSKVKNKICIFLHILILMLIMNDFSPVFILI